MNWKSSLAAALIVAAAGIAAGFVVGGKKTTTTLTHTVTVHQTLTRTVTAAAAGGSTTAASSSTPAAGATTGTASSGSGSGASSSGTQYYSDYLSTQNSDGQLDNTASNVNLDDSASTLQIKGKSYPHAVAFDLNSNPYNQVQESYQLPVPGFKHFSSPVAGLDTNASAKATYKLTVYKNNDNPGATVLFTATFSGPSGTHPVSFNTQGATDLLLDWGQPSSGEPDGDHDQFILADPVVTQ